MPDSAEMRRVEAASSIQNALVRNASESEKSAELRAPPSDSPREGRLFRRPLDAFGRIPDQAGQRHAGYENEQAGADGGRSPAEALHADTHRIDEQRAARRKPGQNQRQRYRLPPDEPAVGGGRKGVSEPQVRRNRHREGVHDEERPVVVYERYGDESQSSRDRAQPYQRPGAQPVHEPAVERSQEARLRPGYGEYEGRARAGEVQVASDGVEEHRRSVHERAARNQREQRHSEQNPPAGIHPRQPGANVRVCSHATFSPAPL